MLHRERIDCCPPGGKSITSGRKYRSADFFVCSCHVQVVQLVSKKEMHKEI